MTFEAELLALGAEIRAERAAQKVSMSDLAAAANISRQALYKYLDAERDMPVAVLLDIAARLDVGADVLMRRAEDRARRDSQR
ncbi:helix-turn-helix domain-containing protein [Brachybacterium muris]|uniref:helix-turn-helix domain-containing protein n=1 Tax=Brachybacterium muris TaxID=219301 RepID=UPI00223BAF45|nr:helix-turn-helix transcriptional regulator [Brachybacterium muris]MCT1430612.1 helix-turn-helix domain-containing protein [Brachybacterium muris]MCT2177462.1 helix-turn-helix domain-containing protein [Brachybacterium muris]